MKPKLILIATVLLIASSGFAAPVYWFGTADSTSEGGPGTWDTVSHHFSTSPSGPADTAWDNTTNPGDPVFEGTPGIVSIGSITNNGTLTVNVSYTFSGTTLTLGPSSAINVAADQTLTESLNLAGGPLTKLGSGTLVIGAVNNYTNNTYLNEGTLALGTGSAVTFGINAPGNHLVINADGVTIAQMAANGRNPQAAVDQLGDFTYDNGVSGASGNIQFTLAQGPWSVKGDRRITTLANTGVGTLLIGPPTYPVPATDRIVEYNGQPASLTKDGPGVLVIQAENDLTGGLTVQAGTVRAYTNVSNPFGVPAATLTLSGGAVATTAHRTSAIANPVSVIADGTITTSATTTPIGFPFSGVISGVGGTTLTFTGNTTAGQAFNPSLLAGFTYGAMIAVVNNGGPTTLQLLNTAGHDQTFADVISGSGALSRSSLTPGTGGNTFMNAANTYSGGTTLNDGGIGLGISSTPGPNSGGPPLNDGPIGTGTLTVSPASGGLPMLFAFGGGEIGNAINLASTAAPLIVSNADTLTLYGLIAGSGSLKKVGAGQLRLSPHNGNSSYAGGTLIVGGEISVDSSSSGPADAPTAGPAGTGTITIANGGALSALSNPRTIGNHLLFSGTAASLTGSRALTLTGNADLSGNNVTLTANNSALTTLSGQLSNGGLTKDGPGTLVLSGTSIYAGGTTVSAGTLDVEKDGGLGAGSVTVASGATLRLTAGTANTYINSAATLTLNGVAPSVRLDFTGAPNSIGALYFAAVRQPNGTWGSAGSGANHESALFLGTGMLQVGVAPVTSFTITHGPGSSLTLEYSGGSGSQFVLLQTNNVAAPLNLWTRLQTNNASHGTFTITPGSDPQEFYRVKSE